MKQNPLFANIQTGEAVYDNADRATYKGITIKTIFLLAITIIIAAFVAFALPTILENNFSTFYVTLVISSIVGIIAVIVGRMSLKFAKYASVIYAGCEGLFLGSISAILDTLYPGIVSTAVFTTIVLFSIMLVLFSTGILKMSSKFRTFCFALTIGAIAITLMVSLFSLFIDYSQYLGVMIFVEVFLLFYGVITLGLNFSEANYVVASGASKDAEWSVSLGLLVSIVYIYVEVLRLLALIAARNDN